MDNPNKPEQPQDDSWLDGILTPPQLPREIGPDEQALSAAGLSEPDDGDSRIGEIVTQIQAEASSPQCNVPEPFRDQEYRDAFGEGDELERMFDDSIPAAPSDPPVQEETIPEEEPPCVREDPR